MNISTFKLSTTLAIAIFVIMGVLSSFQGVEAQSASCNDSDGDNPGSYTSPSFDRLNTAVRGTCSGSTDSEMGGDRIREYYCTSLGTCLWVEGTCPGGSDGNGACIPVVSGAVTVTLPNPLQSDSLQELLNRFLNILIVFGTGIYLLMIFVAALVYITGGADPGKRRTAKNMLVYTTIGYFILVGARVLFAAVQSLFILRG